MNRLLLLLALSVCSTLCAQDSQASADGAQHIGDSGNWVKKRLWVKQAQASNDSLQKDVTAIQSIRSKFYEVYQSYEAASNQFYLTKGFVRGKVAELVQDMHAEVKDEKDTRIAKAKAKSEEDDMPLNYYDVQIEAIEDDVKRFERELKQFELDMNAISEVDQSLSKRLEVLDKHITESTSLAKQGATTLEEMWWMIDDNKARDAYYEIKGLAERSASIKEYLEGPLLSDLKKVGETLKEHIGHIEEQISSLEQRGIIVEHRAERLEQRRIEREKIEKLLAEEREREEAPRRRKRKKKAAQSWGAWVLGGFSSVGTALWNGTKTMLSWVGITINNQDEELRRKRRARRNKRRAELDAIREERRESRTERRASRV